jgi:hypothetical protein
MVYEPKLHQFVGQMLAKTLSREPVRPTIWGPLGAIAIPRFHGPAKTAPKKLHRPGSSKCTNRPQF